MLLIRHFTQQDKTHLIRCLNTTNVTRFLSSRIPYPYTEDDAIWWIEQGSKIGIIRAIEVDGEFVGCVSAEPGQFEYTYSAEVGYWLAEQFWGKGYASKALALLIDEVKNNSEIVRLHASVFEGNLASCQVLEKCGFTAEGYLKKAVYKQGSFYNTHLYANVINDANG
ncbi:GCN5-related N-acetyltransferase [Paraglaciecola sp. T6c]|uniref:GNAT family N-acetyltransferase n=1 Tax=Pseudoalteromonas atlantica (strain T6c / ATCC BAA-1087) TaxID=3042615 RepID=UPI00005C562A|nr:GNAT family N-acetyltransferase [Paraglaciecola sp. T6c]ABG41365.1 GCN5-related N-acetyltransferase [Paraglaciecola sp. T6c]